MTWKHFYETFLTAFHCSYVIAIDKISAVQWDAAVLKLGSRAHERTSCRSSKYPPVDFAPARRPFSPQFSVIVSHRMLDVIQIVSK